VQLMTNNPDKLQQLAQHGVTVAGRLIHEMPANPHNRHYLQTKVTRSGHLMRLDPDDPDQSGGE
jgi:GTP cyclohydrolase II